jgi:Noc2p family
LNKFTSSCKVAAFVKKLKSLQEKIEENNKFIEVARKARNVNLSNDSDVDAWDIFVRSKGEAD